MNRATEPEAIEFDVRSLNEQSTRAKKGKRRALVGGTVFVIAFGLFFFAIDLNAILSGTFSLLRFVTLLIVLAIVGLSLSAIIPGIALTRGGADRVRIDGAGFELYLSSGRILRASWDDPKFSMELLDFSRIPQTNALTDVRHVLRVHRNETALSSEAFDEVLSGSRRHGLEVRSSRASLWVYPSAVAPMVYRVSRLSSRGYSTR
jgi:hypothetical protein